MTLCELNEKDSAKIKFLKDESSLFSRSLLRHGFLPDAILKVLKKIPGKGPLLVSINGCEFVLSRDEASLIGVEGLTGACDL
jgi:Fe2+ transport system protein FeoA